LLAVASLGAGARAEDAVIADPLAEYPGNYRVLLENDRVRVLDFRLAAGASEEAHRHPANVAVFLNEFTIRFTFPDGKTGLREGQPGAVGYSEPVVHASQNVGKTDAHGVLVELKDAPAAVSAAPPGSITAVTLIHGIPGREAELREHLLSLAAPTRAEPGCLQYDLYQSPDTPHEFMRLERWASADALEAHKRTPHIAASFERRTREGWTTQILSWTRVPE
jgi:quinol monooxygenase YgiN